MTGRPPKQEQEPASDAVVEVAPGVLRAQLPIDFTGLGHVNCYLLEDRDGIAIVDPGLPGPKAYKALVGRLRQAGFPISRVHTVVVTHSHPDHFGGAGRVRHESGARIVTHRRFQTMWDPTDPPDIDVEDVPDLLAEGDEHDDAHDDARLHRAHRRPWDPTPWGGPGVNVGWKRRAMYLFATRFPRVVRPPTPTVRLADADTISLAGREWVAIHTPGHTEDHLCLFDPTEGVMLSGDHVLPTITPHIAGISSYTDPLAAFYASLDKVAEYSDDVSVVLPAHGQPLADLAARTEAIKEHHDGRLDRLRKAAIDLDHPTTVAEYSTHLFSPRAQGPMADSETYAHLEHLRLAGEMERIEGDGRYEYALVG